MLPSLAPRLYQGRTRAEWAAALGVSVTALRQRVYHLGWPAAVALGHAPPRCPRAAEYELDGHRGTQGALARALGVGVSTVRARLAAAGLLAERPLLAARRAGRRARYAAMVARCGGSQTEAASRLGVSKQRVGQVLAGV